VFEIVTKWVEKRTSKRSTRLREVYYWGNSYNIHVHSERAVEAQLEIGKEGTIKKWFSSFIDKTGNFSDFLWLAS
jgi:hypothetical protein